MQLAPNPSFLTTQGSSPPPPTAPLCMSSPSSPEPPSPLEPVGPLPPSRDPGSPHPPARCQRSRRSGFPGRHSGLPGSQGMSPERVQCRLGTGGRSQYDCSGELGRRAEYKVHRVDESLPSPHNNPGGNMGCKWTLHLQVRKLRGTASQLPRAAARVRGRSRVHTAGPAGRLETRPDAGLS